jgi:hypothetical protein
MLDDTPETAAEAEKFDSSAFPDDTLFHERRQVKERRGKFTVRSDGPSPPPRPLNERRVRKERRRRIDPTTFEKQYTEDELEFMNAMQQFKVQSCKPFPSHGDVLRVAMALGYRKVGPRVTDAADEEEAANGFADFDEADEPTDDQA